MSEEIFRKKSLDKIKSPENLNDYVRVATPGVWLLLAAIIVLLLGACVWGIFGQIESTLPVTVTVEQGAVLCRADPSQLAVVAEGDPVRLGDVDGTVIGFGEEPGTCVLSLARELPDGSYAAEIVTESIRPLSFVFN